MAYMRWVFVNGSLHLFQISQHGCQLKLWIIRVNLAYWCEEPVVSKPVNFFAIKSWHICQLPWLVGVVSWEISESSKRKLKTQTYDFRTHMFSMESLSSRALWPPTSTSFVINSSRWLNSIISSRICTRVTSSTNREHIALLFLHLLVRIVSKIVQRLVIGTSWMKGCEPSTAEFWPNSVPVYAG